MQKLKMLKKNSIREVLERSKKLGFLGPGPVEDHISHALLYAKEIVDSPGPVVDLGAGGGVPSLPLLTEFSRVEMVLVDALQKRCSFLQWAVVELELQDRVEVVCERAELLVNEPERRGKYSAVIARGFGPPSATLECAAPFLKQGGKCVLSEPPEGREWPTSGVSEFGLEQVESQVPDNKLAVFECVAPTSKKYPRNAKLQKSKPIFELQSNT